MANLEASAAPEGGVDDLYNYDVDTNDAFREFESRIDQPNLQKRSSTAAGGSKPDGLGIDEEIKITKKRDPVAKLDESRLLSSAGIPRLRRISKDRLRFKGKGHEFSDMNRLLSHYQLWLDNLYTRAKFADGISIIEKLGHSKRLQVMRREWINEGKPTEQQESDQDGRKYPSKENGAEMPTNTPSTTTDGLGIPSLAPAQSNGNEDGFVNFASLGDDRPEPVEGVFVNDDLFISDIGDDEPPEDDLDALLAEDSRQKGRGESVKRSRDNGRSTLESSQTDRRESFDDEMDAMLGLNDMW